MLSELDASSLLIVLAVSTYVLGLLFRDQIYIRLLLVVGSVLYIVYYATVGASPLWDAIAGSALIALASLQGIVRLIWSRLAIAVPRDARHIHAVIGEIEPGLFRALMRCGERSVVAETTPMTTHGVRPDALWYLVQGTAMLARSDAPPVRLAGPGFVGEIAWMTGGTASASVAAEPGAEVVRWDHARLGDCVRRNMRLERALEALIAQDLSCKLAARKPLADEGGTRKPVSGVRP